MPLIILLVVLILIFAERPLRREPRDQRIWHSEAVGSAVNRKGAGPPVVAARTSLCPSPLLVGAGRALPLDLPKRRTLLPRG